MPPEQSGQSPREQAQSATDASTLLPSFKGFHVSIRRSHRMTNSINVAERASTGPQHDLPMPLSWSARVLDGVAFDQNIVGRRGVVGRFRCDVNTGTVSG